MELMLSWFCLIKLAFSGIALYAIYKAYWIEELKSKFWNFIAIVAIILSFIQPVKMDVDTRSVQNIANQHIENSKVLPNKVIDESFDNAVERGFGIKEEDLK